MTELVGPGVFFDDEFLSWFWEQYNLEAIALRNRHIPIAAEAFEKWHQAHLRHISIDRRPQARRRHRETLRSRVDAFVAELGTCQTWLRASDAADLVNRTSARIGQLVRAEELKADRDSWGYKVDIESFIDHFEPAP